MWARRDIAASRLTAEVEVVEEEEGRGQIGGLDAPERERASWEFVAASERTRERASESGGQFCLGISAPAFSPLRARPRI